MNRLVAHDAGHGGAAEHVHRVFERGIHRPCHVAHVVAPHLARGVGQTVFELAGLRQQKQARRLYGVAGHAHDARFLALLLAVFVAVHHARDAAGSVVLYAGDMGLGAQLKAASGLGRWQFGVKRGPLGAALAPLKAKAQLQAAPAAVAWLAVDGHVAGVHVFVAQLGGAVVHDLEVVVARQTRDAVGARDAHLGLGPVVIRLKVFVGQRPIEQIGALDLSVDGFGFEFMRLKTQRGTGPVGGGATHGFADPGRQACKVLGQAPTARGGALVQPGQLAEGLPLVVDETGVGLLATGLQHHHLNPFLAQLVGQSATARARADDDDQGVVAVIEFFHC